MPIPYTIVRKDTSPPLYDLTVVTVCRNVLPQLKRTTASVLGQKAAFPHISIEHVIVDGASTDGTPVWLEEMKVQGKIETYISEPDRGIYDAMNKGINLAHGHVLLMLNADDTFAFSDLSECVLPIVRGESLAVGAVAHWYTEGHNRLLKPNPLFLYLAQPICHQALFVSTAMTRQLGGYDSSTLRCAADTDFMHRLIAEVGFPQVTDSLVAFMPGGGYSANCFFQFGDELIEILYRNKQRVYALSQTDPDFFRALLVTLFSHCVAMRHWKTAYSRDIRPQLGKLQELCREAASISSIKQLRKAASFMAECYLADMLAHDTECSSRNWRKLQRISYACTLSDDNPYRSAAVELPITAWGRLLLMSRRIRSKLKKHFSK